MSNLSQPGVQRHTSFQFGEFVYDAESRLLTCRGVKRHLSPKAKHLLHLLLAARPRALSREDLYDALWPSTFVCETNLTTVVKEVRRALGDDVRASQYIRTVHGFGYAFGGEVASAISGLVVATLVCGQEGHPLYSGDNSIGRAPDARVVLEDATVSRRHAVITIHEGDSSFLIRDLASKNGTYVDARQIGPAPVPATDRSLLVFGALGASVVFRKTSTTKTLRLDLTELKREIIERMATT